MNVLVKLEEKEIFLLKWSIKHNTNSPPHLSIVNLQTIWIEKIIC